MSGVVEGRCFTYRVYCDDGVVVTDVKFHESIIEKGDDIPRRLTTAEILNMISDLTDILRAMTPAG